MNSIKVRSLYHWGRLVRRLSGKPIPDSILEDRWQANGSTPWQEGYLATRWRAITEALKSNEALSLFFLGKPLPKGYGFRMDERLVEYPWVFSQLLTEDNHFANWLLDAGSTLNYDSLLEHPLINDRHVVICTLAPEAQRGRPNVSYLYDDLRNCCLQDNKFNVVVSISTLEHIGLDNTDYTKNTVHAEKAPTTVLAAIREIYRILVPGGVAFITVPFGRPANLGWLQVFDSKGLDELVGAFGGKLTRRDFFLYHSTGWQVAQEEDCRDAEYFDFTVPGRPDAPDGAAAARAVACLRLEK